MANLKLYPRVLSIETVASHTLVLLPFLIGIAMLWLRNKSPTIHSIELFQGQKRTEKNL